MISEQFNLGLLHNTSINDENIKKAKNAYNSFVAENTGAIPFNSRFTKEMLVKMAEHKWMNDIEMTLVTKDTYTIDSLYEELENKAFTIDKTTIPILGDKQLKVISIDLEATGLSKSFVRVGGKVIPDTKLVGVCLGVSPFKGYYIPVMHSETDDIKNFSMREIKQLLSRIEQECFTIYHHAQYDREIMSVNGIETHKHYADTMILALHLGLKDDFISIGLKQLSEKLLLRKMVEIHELMDSDYISFDRLCATMAYTYGCSDAVNTYGLFSIFTGFQSDGLPKHKYHLENPFIIQKLACDLDYKANDATRSMMRLGLPIDIEILELRYKTMLRRAQILYDKIYEIVDDGVSISSSEQLGGWIGELLWKQYYEFYKDKADKEALIDKFTKVIDNRFAMTRKTRTLKSGDKVVYNANKYVFAALVENAEDVKWLNDDTKKMLVKLGTYLESNSSIDHELGILSTMYRNCFNDDLGIARGCIDLKFNGADATGRWSNAGDSNKNVLKKRERVQILNLPKKQAQYIPGSTQLLGLNAQGIPSLTFKEVKAKKLTKLPESFLARKNELDKAVTEALTETNNTL